MAINPSRESLADEGGHHPRAALTDFPVHTIYFYYVIYRQNMDPEVRPYHLLRKTSPIRDVEGELERLTINAEQDGNSPACYGDSFVDLLRRRRSYFAVVVERAGYKLDRSNPMRLSEKDSGKWEHTFTKPEYIEIRVGGKTLTGAYCINKMKRHRDGKDLDKKEAEEFDLVLNFENELPFFPDSGGTNMGPPVPPP